MTQRDAYDILDRLRCAVLYLRRHQRRGEERAVVACESWAALLRDAEDEIRALRAAAMLRGAADSREQAA
ncbi:MAG TPA: hypothetical protein VF192_16745 [Longimicrobiales bacterium]